MQIQIKNEVAGDGAQLYEHISEGEEEVLPADVGQNAYDVPQDENTDSDNESASEIPSSPLPSPIFAAASAASAASPALEHHIAAHPVMLRRRAPSDCLIDFNQHPIIPVCVPSQNLTVRLPAAPSNSAVRHTSASEALTSSPRSAQPQKKSSFGSQNGGIMPPAPNPPPLPASAPASNRMNVRVQLLFNRE